MFPLSLRRPLVAAAAIAAAGSLALASTPASAAPVAHYAHGGGGYGSTAKLGTVVQSGQTSVVTMCTLANTTRSNNAAAVNLGAAGKIGAVTTSIVGSDSSGTAQTVSTTKTGAVNLLGGLITADAITSQAVAKHTSSGYTTTGTSSIANLKIAGAKIAANPAKNTAITLPAGLGSVTLNKQTTVNSLGRHQIYVAAMSIKLNDYKLLGLPSGTITVGYANALLHDPVYNRVSGRALASKVSLVGGVVKSGETAVTTLPCAGVTNGKVLSNNTAKVSVPGILTVAAAGSTAVSNDTSTRTAALTTATTGAVNLLNGVVTLDAITVRAHAVKEAGKATSLSTAGTAITNLKIKGKPVTLTVKENTKIDIAGVGTLWLDKTARSSTALSVYGLRLELLNATGGLPVGSVITVGYATAGVAGS